MVAGVFVRSIELSIMSPKSPRRSGLPPSYSVERGVGRLKTYEELLELLGNPNLGQLSNHDKEWFVSDMNEHLERLGTERFKEARKKLLEKFNYDMQLWGED